MSRIITVLFFFTLIIACAPKAGESLTQSDSTLQENPEITSFELGQELINRIRQLPGATVVDRGPRSTVKVSRNDGINNPATPIFVLNGKVYDGDFSQVYHGVIATKGISSVSCLRESHEIAQYGLPGSMIVISINTAK